MPGITMNNTESGRSTDDDNGNAAKKQKLDSMIDGLIVKVMLKNFMTFSEVTFNAHPKLNLIIGPNGSGKSTIVTALILGFGGTPKDINRGDKVSQFVKLGETIADISIELYKKSNENVILRRTIFVSDEPCRYYVNDVMLSRKKYVEVVQNLNIKVQNLCQFLPQDRLEDFSKLDSKGLLLNALHSIENQDLLNDFNKLIKMAESMTTFDVDLKKLQNTIKIEISTNAKLETIVTSFTEKKNLETLLLIVVQKRSWTVYKLVGDFIKRECREFDVAKKQNSDILSLILERKQNVEEKKKMEVNLKNILLTNLNAAKRMSDNMYEKIVAVEKNNVALKEFFKTAKNTFNTIAHLKESILSMEKKLESISNEELVNVDECNEEIGEINKKLKIIDDNIFPMRSEFENINNTLKGHTGKMFAIDQELNREKRKEVEKNMFLERKFPELWKVVTWLRNCDKKAIFRGQVFEPLFTQIEVLDQKYARYIESIIGYRDMIAFVFEYGEDLTKFNAIGKQERWQKINSVSAPPANINVKDTSDYDINNLRQFGFHAYSLDLIKVPYVIKRFLASSYKMHSIPIGSEEVINHVNKLPSNISVFFGGNDKFAVRKSSYTGERITRQSQIPNDSSLLLFTVNSNLVQSLTLKKEEASAECDHFENKKMELKNQLRDKEDSRQLLIDKKRIIQGDIVKFNIKEKAHNKMINDVQSTKRALEREEERSLQFPGQKFKLCDKNYVEIKEFVVLCAKYLTLLNHLNAEAFIIKHCNVDVKDKIQVLNQLKKLYITESNNISEYLKYMHNLLSHLKECKEVALKLTKNVSPYDNEFRETFENKFNSIEECEVEEMDEKVAEIKAKLNCLIIDSNAPQLLKEYEKRKLEIKKMENKLETLKYSAENHESKIASVYAGWFPKLQELSNLLSSNFQKFFTLFGCNGVVELDIGVTRYDFKAYGLLIKVQFRNDEPMRVLDAKSQSGGERALTTALFLLALQEITHFPFRMVDEINQGMDKVYEKKMMELFMDLFENRNNQYIVVTPKLIKNLSFKNTTVHTIFCLGKE